MSGYLNTTEYVGSGPGNSGSDSGTTIGSGGQQYVGYFYGTGYATDTAIWGGTQYVGDDYGTGTATGATIDYEGEQDVGESGGTGYATSTTIDSGYQYVGYNSGTGYATGTTISHGGGPDPADQGAGYQLVGVGSGATGYATSTTIDSGGYQEVGVGSGATGYATSTTIHAGGFQYVGEGGGTGYATDTTMLNGGIQYVGDYDGTGYATGTTIGSYGIQYVGDGSGGIGYATSTTLSGGSEYVASGGTATDTIIDSGGLEDVQSGGVANAPVIDGGTLKLEQGASVSTGPIDFSADINWGTLDLTGDGSGSTLSAPISGFYGTGGTASTSDVIKVTDSGKAGDHVVWTQDTAAQGTLKVEDASNHVLETLTLDGAYNQNQFHLNESGSTDQITCACYCAGTLIATANGEIAVEDLKIGDSVVTASGALREIVWIGTRAYSPRFAGANPDLLPIRFKVGSLADGVPRRDLLVSPEHAMFLDGVLISAKHLVNGATIVREKPEDDIHYFHIELASHDVLIAEGAFSESFVDDDSRGMFQNAHEFKQLYPEARPKEIVYCAPRVEDGFALDRVRRRLAERAGLDYPAATDFGALFGEVEQCDPEGVSGWARNAAFPDAPVCLDVLVDGEFAGYAYADAARPQGGRGFAFRFAAPLDPSRPHEIELRRSADGALFANRLFRAAQDAAA